MVEIPTTGAWTLTTNSDDGVRLWIDGAQVINNWTNHSPTLNHAALTLSAGHHAVRMEYYESTGGAVAQLRWTGPGISQVAIPGTALTTSRANTWEIALANGTYPVAIVCGDPLSLAQANHLLVEGTALTDLDPGYDWTVPGYQAGDFDGYLVSVTVADGKLTLAAGMDAYDPKICFIEIGPAGTTTEVQAMLTAAAPVMTSLIAEATARTAEAVPAVDGVREFVYGSYVDEVVAYTQTAAGVTKRYYPHYNHLYSVSALTDAAGQVVERYTYDAYGRQTITSVGGVSRSKSAVGWDRGFTGYIADQETGLCYARRRMYGPTLGIFLQRDPLRYFMGANLYRAYFVPIALDPFGTFSVTVTAEPVFSTVEFLRGGQTIFERAAAKISADCIGKPCTDRWLRGCVKPCYNNGRINITVPVEIGKGAGATISMFNCRTLRPAKSRDDPADLVLAGLDFIKEHEAGHVNQLKEFVESEVKKVQEKCGDCQIPPIYPWSMRACADRFRGELQAAFESGKLQAMVAGDRAGRAAASGNDEAYYGDPMEEGASRAACQALGFVR